MKKHKICKILLVILAFFYVWLFMNCSELMDPVLKKIETTIKKVADKKGLSVVVDKNTVVYGGLDITDEVSKALQSGK